MRGSMIPILEKIPGIKGAKLAYSLWADYLKKDNAETKKLHSFIDSYGLDLELVHTSGHAVLKDLQTFAEALNSKTLIPIHTFYADRYKELFENVKILKDGEVFNL